MSDPRPIAFSPARLVRRSLIHYWRINLAMMLAAAVGVAVLTGSLLVGASVRGSLRDLTLERLGQIQSALVAGQFFRQALAEAFVGSAPAIVLGGSVIHADSGARAPHVQVLGVDPSFWRLGRQALDLGPIAESDAVINETLAKEIQAKAGDEILIRVERPSAIPRETFLGERRETVATLRLHVARVIASAGLGRFGLTPSQFMPANVYVPLATLQHRLNQPGLVNVILSPSPADPCQNELKRVVNLEDMGFRLRRNAQPGYLSLESASIFLPPWVADQARSCAARLDLAARPTLTYLANSISDGDRSIPYSMVAAWDDEAIKDGEIVLNRWAADELKAQPGDRVALTYFIGAERGGLAETSTTLSVARIVSIEGQWSDRGLTPEFPGIANAASLADWDAPFPLDMKRIRPADEDYWNQYGATPKAFVSLKTGQSLWANRYGNLTSIRLFGKEVDAFGEALQNGIDPASAGLRFQPIQENALRSARGSSDFGGLFIGFSLFLLVSAAMLIQILFMLGVESRVRQLGLLCAVGFSARRVRRLMLAEAGLIAAGGAIAGTLLGLCYAALMIHGLCTWWMGSIGAPFLRLHADPVSMVEGLAGGWLVAFLSIGRAVQRLTRQSVRSLLAGRISEERISIGRGRVSLFVGIGLAILGVALLAVTPSQSAQRQSIFFFTGGACLLVSAMAFFLAWLRGKQGWAPERLTLTRLGISASRRQPGRSLLVAGLMACATFILVATGANRQNAGASLDKKSGSGGFTLMGESAIPLYTELDPKLLAGGSAYNLRLLPGDDASCKNLYQAARPRIAGVPEAFVERGGFAFSAVDAADAQARENPWLLLNHKLADGAIPAIGDANTVLWLLHSGLGKDLTIEGERFRFVALLQGSIFQSELLIGDKNFKRLFPSQSGWRLFVIQTPPDETATVAAALESDLADYGFDAAQTRVKLNAFMTIENTYLSTFQSLGALGLLLGTLGLALALLRNLLERRAEFALLRAVGYRFGALVWLAVAENLHLLLLGLMSGAVCALVAVLPALVARSSQPPLMSLAAMLIGILLFGVAATAVAAAIVLRASLMSSLKEE